MKAIYTLTCRNGYGENCVVRFKAYTILDARIMAENWMKHNFIRNGWLSSASGKRIYVSW